MNALDDIAAAIGDATGTSFEPAGQSESVGGCVNRSFTLSGKDGRRFFVKLNTADLADMFAAEAAGLAEIAATGAIRVPRPITQGGQAGAAWLVLEWLDLGQRGNGPEKGGAELGRRLAAMHHTTGKTFGWKRDNCIGATPQPNPPSHDWISFLREHRLRHQLILSGRNGASGRFMMQGERLLEHLEDFFPGYTPAPSLLHGDLWGGNYGFVSGEPVLFDPAVYYGDREADLAMTELFGGFPADFHAAYREAWPLDAGYGARKHLYNLYHVLNHFNLFGGGYAGQAERIVSQLLAETG